MNPAWHAWMDGNNKNLYFHLPGTRIKAQTCQHLQLVSLSSKIFKHNTECVRRSDQVAYAVQDNEDIPHYQLCTKEKNFETEKLVANNE